jgi:hypothetical protein
MSAAIPPPIARRAQRALMPLPIFGRSKPMSFRSTLTAADGDLSAG